MKEASEVSIFWAQSKAPLQVKGERELDVSDGPERLSLVDMENEGRIAR